ncbi:MAG: glycosyltransferase [Opitutae bacterium]|nr:glycosyltransferase [Opitutae bacterium]MBT6461251.1 glycosyltransferase [Opitutae bacterium]
MPIVSVLLPFHDAFATLKGAVASIREQTFQDWELILVDDGSTDGSRDLARYLTLRDSRIHLIEMSHKGIVDALNTGLKAVSGDFVARMDADDLCFPERLARQFAFLKEHPDIGLVSCLVQHGGDSDAQQGYAEYIRWINELVEPDAISLQRFVESPFAHPSVMFRRELIEKHGSYMNGDFPEDYDLWLRWMQGGVRMAKVQEVLLQWMDLPGRLSRTDVRYRLKAFYQLKFKYLAEWLARSNPFHPMVRVWGAGRVTRQRVAWLEELGVVVEGYYDVDPRKVGEPRPGLSVRSHKEMPAPGKELILVMVGARGAREKIRAFMQERYWVEGRDYLFAA